MFCYLFYYTGRQTLGFAIPGIEAELGIQKDTIGWMITSLLWSYAFGQAINGNLGDKYGGRSMVSLGAILSCGFNWVVSFGTNISSLIVPWIANGYAQSMAWAPGGRVLTNWWGKNERGRVFGMYLFAAGMSSVLAYVSSLIILDVFELNWRWIFRLPVLLMLVGGIVYYLVVRNNPEDLGFESLEDDPIDNTIDPAREITGGETTHYLVETSQQRYMGVLKNWRFLLACLGIGFQSSARYGLLYWVPVHFLGSDWKDTGSNWISIALPIGMALGAITGGWISDKVFKSVRWKLIVSFMLSAAIVSFTMFFLPKDHWIGIVVLFFCGFFAYGSQSAFWALAPDLLGVKRSGTGVGIMNFCAYLFAGLVNPLIGWVIIVNDQNTAMVFPIVGIACLLTVLIGLLIKR
jgi:OPA family glycerol-3-phosphate transporter-like MFS transporter